MGIDDVTILLKVRFVDFRGLGGLKTGRSSNRTV